MTALRNTPISYTHCGFTVHVPMVSGSIARSSTSPTCTMSLTCYAEFVLFSRCYHHQRMEILFLDSMPKFSFKIPHTPTSLTHSSFVLYRLSSGQHCPGGYFKKHPPSFVMAAFGAGPLRHFPNIFLSCNPLVIYNL